MKPYKITICLVALCSLMGFPHSIVAVDIPIPLKPLSVQQYIVKYAQVYNVSEKQLLAVSKCESSYNTNAIGDSGKARGIYQYHLPTFLAFEKEFGEDLDYYSYHDQAKLTAYVFSKGEKYKKHWTCKG